jgi:opacity protein-like surface antigen
MIGHHAREDNEKDMNMKYLLSAAAASALMAGTAFAGNIEPATVEPVITPAPAPMVSTPNWTGFYAGGQLGYADIDSNFAGDTGGDGFIGGLTAGYDFDLGNWVIGAGLDYDWTDIGLGNAAPETNVENIFRAKLRGGYKLGNGLLYATGGYANADTNNRGNEDGYFVGAGYEHMLTQNISLGGEILYHEFDGFNTAPNTDLEATTVQARATFRF